MTSEKAKASTSQSVDKRDEAAANLTSSDDDPQQEVNLPLDDQNKPNKRPLEENEENSPKPAKKVKSDKSKR